MGHASYLQSSFLGGEWAPEVQGHSPVDAYKIALNKCSNYCAIEQGSLVRRQGFQFVGHTKAGAAGRIQGFDISGTPLQLEFTDSWIRFINGDKFLSNGTKSVASISTATPAVVTTTGAHGFSTGDTVVFAAAAGTTGPLFFRQFVITNTGATTFTIVDALTSASIDGSTVPAAASGVYSTSRIAELASPYTGGDWAACTFLQDESSLIIFHKSYAARVITQVATGFGFAINTYTFQDGPYLDINLTATTLTPSAATGSVTITASAITGINGGSGFAATDVGRHIRLYSAPANWAAASTYAVGDQVLYVDGNSYVAIKNNSAGIVPTNIDHWSLLAFLPYWSWLLITAFTDTTHVTATVEPDVTGSSADANAALFNTLATKQWQLGLYSTTTGFPTCGTYHEGRLWASGVTVNRIDGSMSNLYGVFAPSAPDGTVSDANAVAFTTKANENNPILWMTADDVSLIYGTLTSEWVVKASALNDPITPSSVQARRLTTYGSSVGAGAQPVSALRMHIFIQRMNRKLIEVGHPQEAGQFYSPNTVTNLSLTGSHLSKSGIAEIRYTQSPQGYIWARTVDGRLIGLSYLRDADKLNAGWFQAPLGTGRTVTSISSGPSTDSFSNRLYIISSKAGTYWIEMLTDIFDDNKEDYDAFFVDAGIPTPYWNTTATGIKAWGFWAMIGTTLSGTFGTVDMGDAVVAADGSIVFPYTANFTAAYIASLQALDSDITPVIGSAYTSQWQLLRPDHAEDAGARAGPAFGKKRRNHWYAILLNRTQNMTIGTTFGTQYQIPLQDAGEHDVAASSLFSGIVSGTIDDDYSFDGMICGQQTRPVPGQVLAVGGFIESMDK